MKETLPATHLMRQFLLFVLVALFLLLLLRAGHALWQFDAVESLADTNGGPVRLFLTGLRFDVSLIGLVCLVPVVIGPLLAMFESTRWLAKWLVVLWLFAGLAFILFTELLTPLFIASAGERPDASAMTDTAGLADLVRAAAARHPVPSAVASLLVVLILIAYLARMEISRFLRYRLSRPSALLLAVVGGALCVLAAWSNLPVITPMLSPDVAVLGGSTVVDQLSMNSGWTTLHSLIAR